MNALELLSGDAQTFSEEVWASRVHLHKTDPAELVGLLSLEDADRLLTGSALRTPTVRVVQEGSVLPSSRFTRSATLAGAPLTGLVDGRKVLALFEDGATVVLQGLHRYWPPLTELVRDLELRLGHPCQANAYLTPPGSQGFARHSDSHDVFVFQTHGHKQWQVWDGELDDAQDSEGRDVLLEPGLSMYLPTGTPHSARSEAATSLHVTVGINQVTWRQFLTQASQQVLEDEEYDDPLPAGFPQDPGRLAGLVAERLAAYTTQLEQLDAGALADQRATRFLTERTPVLQGGLTDLVGLTELDDHTVLARRATTACVLRHEVDRLVVLLGDRELRMPARLTEPMTYIRDHPELVVSELSPWLDLHSRLVVTRRLVREGLLRIVR